MDCIVSSERYGRPTLTLPPPADVQSLNLDAATRRSGSWLLHPWLRVPMPHLSGGTARIVTYGFLPNPCVFLTVPPTPSRVARP